MRLRRRSPVGLVTLVTRRGCHACALAEELVPRVARRAGVPYEVRDVDADPVLVERHGHTVPVVLLDGVEHAHWQVDERRLRAALRGRPVPPV